MNIEQMIEKIQQQDERLNRLEMMLKVNVELDDINIDYGDILMQVLTKYTGYSYTDIVSKSRRAHLVQIRQAGMNILKEFTSYSLKRIGLVFGGRDHATVLWARQCHNDRLFLPKQNQDYIRDYNAIRDHFIAAVERIRNNEPIEEAEPIINAS